MNRNIRITARVALFAALVFVCSYLSSFIFNVNPAFFIVFSAGFLWGLKPGLLVGIVGFFLYSNFSPYGMATLPVLISQLIGISFTAIIGAYYRRFYASWRLPVCYQDFFIIWLSMSSMPMYTSRSGQG